MTRRLSKAFWISLLTVTIPIVALCVVASVQTAHGGWVEYWRGAYLVIAAIGWWALSLLTAIAFSIWIKGKFTLGLWVGLLISAAIYGISCGVSLLMR